MIILAILERSKGELRDVVGENFMKLSEIYVSEFQKKKTSGALSTHFPIKNEKDETHQVMTEVEPLLEVLEYRTLTKILLNHGE